MSLLEIHRAANVICNLGDKNASKLPYSYLIVTNHGNIRRLRSLCAGDDAGSHGSVFRCPLGSGISNYDFIQRQNCIPPLTDVAPLQAEFRLQHATKMQRTETKNPLPLAEPRLTEPRLKMQHRKTTVTKFSVAKPNLTFSLQLPRLIRIFRINKFIFQISHWVEIPSFIALYLHNPHDCVDA